MHPLSWLLALPPPLSALFPALLITLLYISQCRVTASLGAEWKCNWPCFINSVSGAQEEKKKTASTNPHLCHPLDADYFFMMLWVGCASCRGLIGVVTGDWDVRDPSSLMSRLSACRWLGRARWAAAGSAPRARTMSTSRMSLPARRVSWDGGPTMNWQVGGRNPIMLS